MGESYSFIPGLLLLSASSVFAMAVCEKAAKRSEVDGT